MGVVAKREGRMLLTEKTLVIAVLIQLFVASFSAFMSVGFAVMFSPGAISPHLSGQLNIGVVEGGTGTSEQLINTMFNQVNVRRFSTAEEAQTALRNGWVDAVMIIKDAPDDPGRPIQLEMYLPKNNFKSSLVTVQVKQALEQFQEELRSQQGISILTLDSPINVDDVSKFFEFKYTVLVPLLILLPAFLSGGMIIDMITEEYELGTLDMLKASPLKFSDVIYGKMLVMVLIAPLQAAVWILLLELNRIHVEHPLEILLFLTLVTLILVQAGVAAVHIFQAALSRAPGVLGCVRGTGAALRIAACAAIEPGGTAGCRVGCGCLGLSVVCWGGSGAAWADQGDA